MKVPRPGNKSDSKNKKIANDKLSYAITVISIRIILKAAEI